MLAEVGSRSASAAPQGKSRRGQGTRGSGVDGPVRFDRVLAFQSRGGGLRLSLVRLLEKRAISRHVGSNSTLSADGSEQRRPLGIGRHDEPLTGCKASNGRCRSVCASNGPPSFVADRRERVTWRSRRPGREANLMRQRKAPTDELQLDLVSRIPTDGRARTGPEAHAGTPSR